MVECAFLDRCKKEKKVFPQRARTEMDDEVAGLF